MKAIVKRGLIILLIVVLLLALLNPSPKQFREDTGFKNVVRTSNWLVFSMYRAGTGIYIAIALNYFYIRRTY